MPLDARSDEDTLRGLCAEYLIDLRKGAADMDRLLSSVASELRPRLQRELKKVAVDYADMGETLILSSDVLAAVTQPSKRLKSAESSHRLAALDPSLSHSDLAAYALSSFAYNALGELPQEVQHKLSAKLIVRRFQTGDKLIVQDEPGAGMFILVEGEVKIELRRDEQGVTLDHSFPGDILGEMSLLTGTPCTADVVAVHPTCALLLTRNDFDALNRSHPELEIALCQLVSDRLGGHETDALSGKQVGEYHLRRCVKRGGMGVVYEANDPTEQRVALKMLRHRFVHDPEVVDSFLREGELLASLTHPNIVSVKTCFVAFNTRFLVLDYWDGMDLACILKRHGPLSEDLCRAILGQVAQGVRRAHQAGVLHLDIKPANILVTKDGQVALTDFGLAKLMGVWQESNVVFGTVPYMPPEQLCAGQLSAASDWYALACTAAELLSGSRLFDVDSFQDAWDAKFRPQPDEDWPVVEASRELRRMLAAALHPEPLQRQLDLDIVSKWAQPVPGLC